MKTLPARTSLVSLTLLVTLSAALPATAQTAGSTVDVHIIESTRDAMGWSVKKSLFGKTLYNDAGDSLGEIDDLIISPDTSVSFAIVEAGGFIGIGQHDVAIPIQRIDEKDGKLVVAGATKETIKAMPAFTYATDMTARDRFIASTERDVAKGHATITDLEKRANNGNAGVAAKIDVLQANIKSVDAALVEIKQAADARWREYEEDINAATARLQKSIAAANS